MRNMPNRRTNPKAPCTVSGRLLEEQSNVDEQRKKIIFAKQMEVIDIKKQAALKERKEKDC